MATMDVYGFANEDLLAARRAVEGALSIRLEEAEESDGSGYYFRGAIPSGPWGQIRSNSGSSIRWHSHHSTRCEMGAPSSFAFVLECCNLYTCCAIGSREPCYGQRKRHALLVAATLHGFLLGRFYHCIYFLRCARPHRSR